MSALLTSLALRLADQARGMGLTLAAIEASRQPASNSRYLQLRDAAGRPWSLRVSDHERAMTADRPRPQFNLVLRACEIDQAARVATAWLARVAAGEVAWTDPAPARPPRRRR